MAESSVKLPTTRSGATDSDDDDVSLPSDTMAILQTFLREQAEREKALSTVAVPTADVDAENSAVTNSTTVAPTFKAFEENWQLSQFWYNDRTKRLLAGVCAQLVQPGASPPLSIALLSCPSLYDRIRAANPAGTVSLFEFDARFAAYGRDFVHFDYKRGSAADVEYLRPHHGQYDVIIVDPPFLAEECIERMSHIVRRLRRDEHSSKVVLCSGQVVADWAAEHMALRPCQFHPEHERQLGNEFTSYANFDLDEFIQRVDEV